MPAGIRAPAMKMRPTRKSIDVKKNIKEQKAWLRKRKLRKMTVKELVASLQSKKTYKKKESMKAKTKTKAYYDRKKKGIKNGLKDNAKVKYV